MAMAFLPLISVCAEFDVCRGPESTASEKKGLRARSARDQGKGLHAEDAE
jgi:hypothetical protein